MQRTVRRKGKVIATTEKARPMAITKVTDFFKVMLSISRDEPFTRTARFTQWSALLAYSGGGLSMLFAPNLWQVVFSLEASQRSRGYLRLTGCYLVALSFIYVIVSRASSRALGGVGPILASVPERLFYVNGALLMMYLREMVPLGFAALFMVLDSSLALATLILWCSETNNPSPGLFLKEITAPLFEQPSTCSSAVSRAFRTGVGVIQLVSGLVLMTIPSRVQTALHLDPFVYGAYASGFLSSTFLLVSIHGLFHILPPAGEGGFTFGIAAVFYRAVLVLPGLSILFALDEIERQLALFLGSLEVAFAFAIFVSFLGQCKENRVAILRQESSGSDE